VLQAKEGAFMKLHGETGTREAANSLVN